VNTTTTYPDTLKNSIPTVNSENQLEEKISELKETLQNYEDTDPAYMNEEIKELRHFTMYTHLRMEESLGHLLVRSQLASLAPFNLPKEAYQAAFSSGTTIAIEVDYARKVNLAQSYNQIDSKVGSLMYQVNELRKYFSHPSKYYAKLAELRDNRDRYKEAMEQLVNAHKAMNEIFQQFVSSKVEY
jgi:hypothetical protein